MIRAGDGSTTLANADVIHDFKDGTDLIGMADGLEYSQLTIEQGTGDYAHMIIVKKTDTGEFLVILHTQGINGEGTISASDMSNADFTAI